jgi:hypothetical protein
MPPLTLPPPEIMGVSLRLGFGVDTGPAKAMLENIKATIPNFLFIN